MTHKMNLYNDSFESIKSGKKTIEMRLFDEKRSIIKPNDYIEFNNTINGETLLCVVINIYKYNNFEELYKNHDKISIGYEEDETASPDDMLMYYSIDNINKYGVVGIEVKKLWLFDILQIIIANELF